VLIRDLRDSDGPSVRGVITAAFDQEPVVADLSEALRARPDLGATLVAEEDGGLIGVVQLSSSWVDAPRELLPVLVLSPLAVHPDQQHRGVGRALVDAAIDKATGLESPLLFLEGDPAYYSRLGWQRASELGFTPPSVRIPDAAFQVVVLPGHELWMTGALVYNDTFWTYDSVGLRET
jgi:putative acetyltransferase